MSFTRGTTKYKRVLLFAFAALLLVAVFCIWYTRPESLPKMFGIDPEAESGFVSAHSWYPFTENDTRSMFYIDTSQSGAEVFYNLAAILDNMTCRRSLTPNRWPDTVVGEASTDISYCRGDVEINLIFNDKFLLAGTPGEPTRTLYIVDREDSRRLAAFVSEHGYNRQGHVEDMQNAANATQKESSSKEWTEQEILSLFEAKTKPNWTVIDCVRAPDFAFDRIGVVLFVDNDNGHYHLAFLDADGYYALCGTHGQLSVPAELEYCGNGIVTFKVKAKDGLVYECKITFSQSEDRRETNFIHEDNLEDILAEK